jgi:hypothetical protein
VNQLAGERAEAHHAAATAGAHSRHFWPGEGEPPRKLAVVEAVAEQELELAPLIRWGLIFWCAHSRAASLWRSAVSNIENIFSYSHRALALEAFAGENGRNQSPRVAPIK